MKLAWEEMVTQVLVVVGVLLGVALIVGALGLVALYGLATKPDRFAVRAVPLDAVDDYLHRRASARITVTVSTPLSRDEVWQRLCDQPYLSRLPLITGPTWATAARGVGARRTMSGTFIGVGEQVVEAIDNAQITLSGAAVSVPMAIANFAERFTLTAGPRETVLVTWTIAGTPRWVGWLPWQLAVPLVRPLFAYFLRHVLRLRTFRAQREFGTSGG